MAFITIERGNRRGQAIRLSGDRALIGRHPNCQILLDHSAVSRSHAEIFVIGTKFYVQDLESSNGTLVNGELIRDRVELNDGDEFRICGFAFSFHLGDPPEHKASTHFQPPAASQRITGRPAGSDTDPALPVAAAIDTGIEASTVQLAQNPEAKLKAILQLNKALGHLLTFDSLLPALLESLFRIFPVADAAAAFFVDTSTNSLKVKLTKSAIDQATQTNAISQTVAEHSWNSGDAVLVRDSNKDERFRFSDSIRNLKIRSIVCAPFLDDRGDTIGVVQLAAHETRDTFTKDDLDVFVSVVAMVQVAILRALRHDQEVREFGDKTRRAEDRLDVAIGRLPVVVWTTDTHLKLTSIAGAAIRNLNSESSQAIGRTLFDIFETDDLEFPTIAAHLQTLNGLPVDFEQKWSAHSYFAHVEPLADGDGKILGCVGVALDVTEKQQAEQQASENRQRFELLVQASPAIVFCTDQHGTPTFVSDVRWRELTGLDTGTWAGEGWVDAIHADDRERVVRSWRQAVAKGKRWEAEMRFRHVDGTVRWMLGHALPIFGNDEQLRQYIGVCTNITDRKRAEDLLRQMNTTLEAHVSRRTAELARSNADLQQFAYTTSHDLQEPLRSVRSFCQLLRRHTAGRLDATANEYMEEVIAGAGRMSLLIDDLLEFSRVETGIQPVSAVNCEDALAEALKNLATIVRESEAVITHDTLPSVVVDRTQLIQVLQNLVGNAIKFRRTDPPEVHVAAQRDGVDWLFSVRDNGIGVVAKFFERIFNVFQRLHTREEYPGTGMGLPICKRIVARYGGRIWLESQPGVGSVFYFTLPADEPVGMAK